MDDDIDVDDIISEVSPTPGTQGFYPVPEQQHDDGEQHDDATDDATETDEAPEAAEPVLAEPLAAEPEPEPAKPVRKPGQRKRSFDDETTGRMLKVSKSFVRGDFGGKNPEEQIRQRALEQGLDLGPLTIQFIRELIDQQLESCRLRIYPRIDEAITRAGESANLEAAP